MYFVLDENNNRIEALDKEGVFAVLEQAIADGSLKDLVANEAFVSKLKCCVSGETNRVAFVTQAKYNELVATGAVIPNCYYFITDDATIDGMESVLETMQLHIVGIENGTYPAQYANGAPVAAVVTTANVNNGKTFVFGNTNGFGTQEGIGLWRLWNLPSGDDGDPEYYSSLVPSHHDKMSLGTETRRIRNFHAKYINAEQINATKVNATSADRVNWAAPVRQAYNTDTVYLTKAGYYYIEVADMAATKRPLGVVWFAKDGVRSIYKFTWNDKTVTVTINTSGQIAFENFTATHVMVVPLSVEEV